jgi:hypothetical protein
VSRHGKEVTGRAEHARIGLDAADCAQKSLSALGVIESTIDIGEESTRAFDGDHG